jgi:glycosyltransferase involved in cell wall biosynthesis
VRVTVITPTLNSERWFGDCLASIDAQRADGIEIEHVVVDERSTDGTAQMARSQGARVVYGRDEGIYGAMNVGLEVATGDLVGILNSDDALLPGALRRVVDARRRSDRRWVVGGSRWTDGSGRVLGDLRAPPRWVSAPIFASLGWCCILQHAAYLDGDLLHEVGGFDTSYRIAGDYEFFARVLSRAQPTRLPGVLALYRRHGDNLSLTRMELMTAENDRVAAQYGPAAPAGRRAAREVLRVWVNARNLRWSRNKHGDARP